MNRSSKRWVSVSACCVVTLATGAGITETRANCAQAIPSAYVCALEVSQSDLETTNSAGSVFEVSPAARFRLLADDWRRATRYESSVTRAILHPSHMLIVGMDKNVVLPFIFTELRDKGGHWFWALHFLTGESIGDRDDSLATVKAKWLEWGHNHGYLYA